MSKLAKQSVAPLVMALWIVSFAGEIHATVDGHSVSQTEQVDFVELLDAITAGDPDAQRLALQVYYGSLQSTDPRQQRDALALANSLEPHVVDPDARAEFQMHLATAYRNNGDNDHYQATLDRLAEENPDFSSMGGFSANYERALDHLRGSNPDYDSAIAALEPLLPYSETISGFQRGRIGVQLTNLYRNTGKFDKAIVLAELTRGFLSESDVNKLTLLNDLAESYFATENYELAAMVYDEVAVLARNQNPNPNPAELAATLQVDAPLRAAAARDRAEALRVYGEAPAKQPEASDGDKSEITTVALVTNSKVSEAVPGPIADKEILAQSVAPTLPRNEGRSDIAWFLSGSVIVASTGVFFVWRRLRRKALT